MAKLVADISVSIPTVRSQLIHTVLRAFDRGTVLPSEVLLVSNEVELEHLRQYSFPVRIVKFDSTVYSYGHRDIALRRNIGVWESYAKNVLCFDDDEIPQPDVVEVMSGLLSKEPYVWGHHRYLHFDEPQTDEESEALITLLHSTPASSGTPREKLVNAANLHYSGYGGLFGCDRSLLTTMGGFDMAHHGGGGEDQAVARQLSNFLGGDGRIFVHEPPFAWCSSKLFVIPFITGNVCTNGNHTFFEATWAGLKIQQCSKCPYYWFPNLQADSRIRLPFNRSAVTTIERVVEAI